MRPSFVHLLELGRLRDNFELSRLESVGKNVKTFLGSEIVKTARRGASPQVVFVRAISFSAEIATKSGAESALRSALGELERTFLLPGVSPTASSRIFLNLMPQYDISPSDAANSFYSIMETLLPQYATRLVALRVDEIEVKLRCKGDDGETQPVRLTASSMSGEWLRTSAFLEYPDPITGVTERFCSLDGADPDSVGECFLSPYPSSSGVQLKRAAARRAGST
jgi:acetyl-CoA carboxylase/biotin carboxylase 1